MNKPKLSPQRARERDVFRYRSALERGDFDTVIAILKIAERDPILMQMIEEMAELDDIPLSRPEKDVSSFFRQSKGITQLVNRRDSSPNGWPPKPNQNEEEDNMNTTSYSNIIRRGKYGLNPNFLTVIAASVMVIFLGTALLQWVSNPIHGSYGTLIESSPTPTPAGCQVVDNADLPAESVRLAQASTELLTADTPDTELAALLSLCALQTAYTPEADAALQQALDQANLMPLLKGHQGSLFSSDFSPDGKYIVTSSWDGTARLWDAATLTEIRQFKQPALVIAVSFSPDGQYILTSGNNSDPNVRLWETATGNLLQIFKGHTNTVVGVAFSPDGKYGLSASHDGTARLWNLATGEAVRTFQMPKSSRADQAQIAIFSRDGSRVIVNYSTISGLALLQEFNTETGEPTRQFAGKSTAKSVWGLDVSADGRYLLTLGESGAAIWDYQTGQEIRVFSEAGGGNNGGSGTFSPDGRLILVSTHTTSKSVLDLLDAETGQLIRVFTKNAGGGAFSPDGRHIVTVLNRQDSTSDPNATVYDTDYHDFIAFACSKVTRDFTAEERLQYGLNNGVPTCPQFGQGNELPPGMTPIATQPIPVWTPIPTPAS